MKHVLLDANFILSCIRKNIDFFYDIQMMGFTIIIPKQVLEEVKDLSHSKTEAEVALKILQKNKFKKITLSGKIVDDGIVKAAKENESWIIATLDREIQKKILNQKLIIRGEKGLAII